jgi:hypothetical protein
VFAECDVHLDGPLTVSDVVYFLVCELVDEGEDRRQIVVCHVLEGEIPELLAFVGVERGVVAAVFVAPTVPQPDVVALIGQHEPWGLIFIIDEPGVGAVQKSMLKQDGFEAFLDDGILSLNAEDSQNVSILGDHLMFLNRIVIIFTVVHELQFGFRVGAGGQGHQQQHG